MHWRLKRGGAVALLAGMALIAPAAAQDKNAEQAAVAVGKPAPDIELPAVNVGKALPDKKDAKTLGLKELQGKNVVLFFFPKAFTGGWTAECRGFRAAAEQFAQLDTVLVGVSTDTLETQARFAEQEKLGYPLLADPEKKGAKSFGVLSPRGFANRSTFVIDKKGVVRKIYPKVTPATHAEEVLKYVKEELAGK